MTTEDGVAGIDEEIEVLVKELPRQACDLIRREAQPRPQGFAGASCLLIGPPNFSGRQQRPEVSTGGAMLVRVLLSHALGNAAGVEIVTGYPKIAWHGPFREDRPARIGALQKP